MRPIHRQASKGGDNNRSKQGRSRENKSSERRDRQNEDRVREKRDSPGNLMSIGTPDPDTNGQEQAVKQNDRQGHRRREHDLKESFRSNGERDG